MFPLDSGDRLTRAEFERRYSALPELKKAGLKKAELIEGIVYIPSPARHWSHGKPHSRIVAWLVMYAAQTCGVDCSDKGTVRMDMDNEPQPDALLMIAGGRCHVDEDDYLEGAPELISVTASLIRLMAGWDFQPKALQRKRARKTHL